MFANSDVAVTASTLSNSASSIGQVLEAVAGFFAILLLVFYFAGRATGRFAKPTANLVFLGPAIVLICVGLVIPTLRTIYLSFYGAQSEHFVGWQNYTWVFGSSGERKILLTTLLWLVIPPIVATSVGLAVALLVDRMKRQSAVKSLIFLPTAISFVGASVIWKFVYDYREPSQPQIGLLSQIVMSLGWKHPPNWLLTQPLNTFLLMVIMVWIQTGFAMVVLSAAIKAIPDEIVEAARVDGAKGFRLFASVQIPMIRSTLIVVLVTIMIATLKTFDIVRTVTGGNFGTDILSDDMYSRAFVQNNLGRGSALAVILFVAVLPIVGYNIVQLRKERATR